MFGMIILNLTLRLCNSHSIIDNRTSVHISGTEEHSDLKEKITKIEIEQEECIPKNIRGIY